MTFKDAAQAIREAADAANEILTIEDPVGSTLSVIEARRMAFATLSVVDDRGQGAALALTPDVADRIAAKLREWATAARERQS